MIKVSMLTFLFIILLYFPASAEFYKYTGSDGNVRYTDDLSKIPEPQRSKITSYEESASDPRTSTPSRKPKSNQLTPKATPEADGHLDEERRQINQKQDTLSKEYKALMEEKERLTQASKQKMNIIESVELDRRTDKLKEKIEQYEQKRKALNNEIEAYNDRMSKKEDGDKQ